ncbi:MAG: LLM class flavin-dependent oxidoreductase, partial [Myxococcales bacterium]
VNSPAPISKIPIMIGGGGEKKTLRMVAQYADESNLICETDEIPRKLEALAGHCERLGRDRSEITVTKLMMVAVAPTMEELEADMDAIGKIKGWNDAIKGMLKDRLIYGDPDTVGEKLSDAVSKGLDGITVDLPVNGHNLERIELLGEISRKVLG